MSDLSTELYVSAAIRQARSDGHFAYLRHRGFAERGSVLLIRTVSGKEWHILTQTRNPIGNPAWLTVMTINTAAELEAYVNRSIQSDPDLWIIELECSESYNPFGWPELKTDW